jgi:class 3 adenylate cyclase
VKEIELSAHEDREWPATETVIAPDALLRLHNATSSEQLFIVERMAWSDQAATAAEVTALQVFRDLFSSEALRPGEKISVGTLAVIFTDLRESTRLYREIGDAPAFGMVMNHFDVLREVVIAEEGAIVKTMGDSVMAVFRRPLAALRAVFRVQSLLSKSNYGHNLRLKAGIHFGPCIAVNLNERLDYFGSTVNIAARLESLSSGSDVIISGAVRSDPEVAAYLATPETVAIEPVQAILKGFEAEPIELWRVARLSG